MAACRNTIFNFFPWFYTELRTWTKKTTFFASFFVSFCSSFDNHKTYVLFVPFRFISRHFLPQFGHIHTRYVSSKLIISVFFRVQESNVPGIGVRRYGVRDSNKYWDNFHSTFKKNGDFGRFERRLIRSTLGFFETLRLRFVRVFESSFRSQLCFKLPEILCSIITRVQN